MFIHHGGYRSPLNLACRVDAQVFKVMPRPDLGKEPERLISDMIKKNTKELRLVKKLNAEKLSKIQDHREAVRQYQRDERLTQCLDTLITAYESTNGHAKIVGDFLGSPQVKFGGFTKRRTVSAGLINVLSCHTSKNSSYRLNNADSSGRPRSSVKKKLSQSLRQSSTEKLSGVKISFSPKVKSSQADKSRNSHDTLTTLRLNHRY